MKHLKIYDPDPEKSFTKAKLARLKQEQTGVSFVDVEIRHAANYFNNFPAADSAFTTDFSLLPNFVPTDTLEHLKNCRKNTMKTRDAIVEFASFKGLTMLPFVHDLQVRKGTSEKHVIYLRALCWASYRKPVKYKVKMVVQRNRKPKILAAESDKICPAGKSGCCCYVMAGIWKLDEIFRKNVVQQVDNRSYTSKT